tara:strand:+ start:109 stop:2316 length:2208 start_codon:yes stop_codon:yes gene_type:complete
LGTPLDGVDDAIAAGGATLITREDVANIPRPGVLAAIVSGHEAADELREWRADPRFHQVPVIALVDYVAEGPFRDALVAGADDAVARSDRAALTRRIATLRGATPTQGQRQGDRGTILLVDGDQERRRLFGRTLGRTGLDVRFASSLEEASAEKVSPDVAVVHETLGEPGNVHYQLREALGSHDVPVVLITDEGEADFGGRRIERTASVPTSVPADHLLFVINELLNPAAAEQRSSPRLLYSTLCAFRSAGDLVPSHGVVYNISRNGLFVRSLDPPNVGDTAWLELRPPQSVGAVHLRGTVAWRTLGGGTNPPGFAVQLLPSQMPTEDLERYRDCYRRLLDEPVRLTAASSAPPTAEAAPRLLIVDDEEVVRSVMARIFRDTDYEVTLASDGEEAIQQYRRLRHDAVVTDVQMPNMSGIELLKAIRADDENVPVIITTGEPTTDSAIEAVHLGALRYLVKPIDPATVRDVVHRAVGMARLARYRRQAARVTPDVPSPNDDLDERFSRAVDLLFAHFQPIVAWPDKEVIAYEALARTSEPSIPHPGVLFDAAERLDRVADVGRRMREITPKAMAKSEHKLFLNLHPTDLLDEQLYDPESPLAAIGDRVVMEITERASLARVEKLKERVDRLRELGFKIAVDDLGAGYAGLSAFVALMPDVVKLDMSLIRGIDESKTKQRLVHSMINVSNDLGIQVIAEGVETRAELDVLAGLGCTLFQGFFFARPGFPLPDPDWPT